MNSKLESFMQQSKIYTISAAHVNYMEDHLIILWGPTNFVLQIIFMIRANLNGA